MNLRAMVEKAIEAAIDSGLAVDGAIATLDAIDGDADLEGDVCEEGETPPLMDGGWGYSLGRLPVYDQCPCCGHRTLDCYAVPVLQAWDGDTEKVL